MTTAAPYLSINNITKTYQQNNTVFTALKDFSLTVNKREFITIVGASGCGKSTLLRLLCGLDTDYEGSITLNEQPITKPTREIGVVFQEPRLLPWLTIKQNIALALTNQSAAVKEQTVQHYLELINLPDIADLYPRQLSGGMAQRAAIARALSTGAELLLLDEPLGALDAMTRRKMQKEILKLWQHEQKTMLLVTHDIDEAIYLGTKIVMMSASPGRIHRIINVPSNLKKEMTDENFIRLRSEIYNEFSL